ncbi:hypothetical protein ACLOJK_028284 [Asimina triloba]
MVPFEGGLLRGEPSASGASVLASQGHHKRKKCALKRSRLSTKEELARNKEEDLQMVMTLSLETTHGAGLIISPPKAPAKPNH